MGPRQAMNPIAQTILTLIGLALLGGLFFLGLIFFAVFAAIAIIAGSIIWLRIWWIRRQAIRAGQPDPFAMRLKSKDGVKDYVDGEFVVIERKTRPP